MFLHKRRLFFVVMLFVLLIGIAGLPVYAQDGPKHTGQPYETVHVRDVDEAYPVADCGDYGVWADVHINENVIHRWRDENDTPLLTIINFNEDVTLSNTATGRSVDVILRFTGQFDIVADVTTLSGIRTAIVYPTGETEPANVGHLAISGISGGYGEVLSMSGRWDAVTDGIFDHASFACKLVAD